MADTSVQERFLVRSRLIAIVDHLVEASDDDGA